MGAELVAIFPAPIQPSSIAVPRVSLTDRLALRVNDNIDSFLTGQYERLPNIVEPYRENTGAPWSRQIIFCTSYEIPNAAEVQGFINENGLNYLCFLVDQVFEGGANGWPTPIRRIGQAVAREGEPGSVPWISMLCPAGVRLVLNGQTPTAMTTSPSHSEMFILTDAMKEMTLKRHTPSQKHEVGQSTTAAAVTFFSGTLWTGEDWLLPSAVLLHEASHYTNYIELQKWVARNASLPDGQKDPAFIKHCTVDGNGKYRVDFGFATLFLELAACLSTATYFECMLNSSLANPSHGEIILDNLAHSLTIARRFMRTEKYAPYFASVQIPAPGNFDVNTVINFSRRFTSMVWGE